MAIAIIELNIEDAVRDFLIANNSTITGSSGKIPVYVSEFPPDASPVSILVRKAGGLAPDEELVLYKPWFQVWCRADERTKAVKIMERCDYMLHRLGPKALNDDIFALSIIRNTGIQRLDDPVQNLVQYFAVYSTVIREA